jgi:hypothetical protein
VRGGTYAQAKLSQQQHALLGAEFCHAQKGVIGVDAQATSCRAARK